MFGTLRFLVVVALIGAGVALLLWKPGSSGALSEMELCARAGGQGDIYWCYQDPTCSVPDRGCGGLDETLFCGEHGTEGLVCANTQEYQAPQSCNNSMGDNYCSPTSIDKIICYKSRKCKCHWTGMAWTCAFPAVDDWNDPYDVTLSTDVNCFYETVP
jgi:hypothetical protein